MHVLSSQLQLRWFIDLHGMVCDGGIRGERLAPHPLGDAVDNNDKVVQFCCYVIMQRCNDDRYSVW